MHDFEVLAQPVARKLLIRIREEMSGPTVLVGREARCPTARPLLRTRIISTGTLRAFDVALSPQLSRRIVIDWRPVESDCADVSVTETGHAGHGLWLELR